MCSRIRALLGETVKAGEPPTPGLPEGAVKEPESGEGGESGEHKVKRRQLQEGKGTGVKCCHRHRAWEHRWVEHPGSAERS